LNYQQENSAPLHLPPKLVRNPSERGLYSTTQALHTSSEAEDSSLENHPFFKKNVYAGPALHKAVLDGKSQEVQRLLNTNIPINEKDMLGNTALHYVSRLDTATALPLTKMLLEKGANATIKNTVGKNAYDLARAKYFSLFTLLHQDELPENNNVANGTTTKLLSIKNTPPRIDWDFNAISPRLINKAKRTINEAEKISEIIKTKLIQQQNALIQRDISDFFPKKTSEKHPSAQDSYSSKSKKDPRTEK
jgi:ankyrin repeat protein